MKFGEKIRILRKNRNMSQEQLANYLKINRNYLSRIETDKCEPPASIIKSLSLLFHVSVTSLLDMESTEATYEEKIKYVNENCSSLLEQDLDFIVRIISIMKEEDVKEEKTKNRH